MTGELYLGVDVGSVSTNVVLMNSSGEIVHRLYLKTAGRPVEAIRQGMGELRRALNGNEPEIAGVGTTGSGRLLAGAMLGADLVKNEISAHAVAARRYMPDVRTVLEIGGQDSKIILLKDSVVSDFAMNTVCAAGTGSFLDRQAERLGIPIGEFGGKAKLAHSPVAIAGRCAVFAESDMIHKQQNGHRQEDIIAGLCDALVRNYLNNLAKGKEITAPVVFQGGVAANAGMVDAFGRALGMPIHVPKHYDVMGAWGAALLAAAQAHKTVAPSHFVGFDALEYEYSTETKQCSGCANLCELVVFSSEKSELARWGGRCGKWSS
jgi:predicted CoA-substrate-specific enzyme activase